MGPGRSVQVRPAGDRTEIIVRSGDPEAELAIEVRFDATGPVVSVRARQLELGAERVLASCEHFSVQASESIELRSGGGVSVHAGGSVNVRAEGDMAHHAAGRLALDGRHVQVEATPGAVRVLANDDVQLCGENVLLNCDREPPLPAWARAGQPGSPQPAQPSSPWPASPQPGPPSPLPPQAATGDAELLRRLLSGRAGAIEPRR